MARQRRTTTAQNAFLAALRQNPSVTEAALVAGITRTRHYYWMRIDPEYAAAFKAAVAVGEDAYFAECRRRAKLRERRRILSVRTINRRFLRKLSAAMPRHRLRAVGDQRTP